MMTTRRTRRKNKKTKRTPTSEDALPPLLVSAIAAEEALLMRRDKLADTLSETSDTISRALALERQLDVDLGVTEIAGGDVGHVRTELTATRDRHQSAIRRRQAASAGLLGLEAEVAAARAAVDAARCEYANTVLLDFTRRWNLACSELAVLQAEAQQLSAALRTTVTCPPPYIPSVNVVTSAPELHFKGAPVPPPLLSGELARVTAVLDRLYAAARLVGAIQQAAAMDSRHYELAKHRIGMPSQMTGVFVVIKPFSHLDREFAVGMLVNRDLMGDGLLHRLVLGKNVRVADPAAAIAAA